MYHFGPGLYRMREKTGSDPIRRNIEPCSPGENGYIESFNGKLRDELLSGELFYTLWEAQVIIERWRQAYNQVRPHSALGYRPPAPETIEPQPMSA